MFGIINRLATLIMYLSMWQQSKTIIWITTTSKHTHSTISYTQIINAKVSYKDGYFINMVNDNNGIRLEINAKNAENVFHTSF